MSGCDDLPFSEEAQDALTKLKDVTIGFRWTGEVRVAVVGKSGVGKSALINQCFPGLERGPLSVYGERGTELKDLLREWRLPTVDASETESRLVLFDSPGFELDPHLMTQVFPHVCDVRRAPAYTHYVCVCV